MSDPIIPGRVLVIGVFDLFHVGHLRYLQHARARARELVVGVTPDAICLEIKKKRPVIRESQRMELIRGLGWVDEVRLIPTTTEATAAAAEWIAAWNIDQVMIGGAWENTPRWRRLEPALAERGILTSYVPMTGGISTSDIVQRIMGSDTILEVHKNRV